MQFIQAFYEPSAAPPFVPKFNAVQIDGAFAATGAAPLGAGSFAETWRITLGSDVVAAKIITNPSYPLALLIREIEGLRSCDSPHIVRLIDDRMVLLNGDHLPALVFEYIDGGDVASHLAAGNRPNAEELREFASGLLTAISLLHGCNTVHRDIKPENIALRDGDWTQPVLLDLGLAKVLDQQTITQYPTVMGTVPFMAPEQLQGDPARQMADMFAIGVVLYLLHTGNHPYYGPKAQWIDGAAAIQRIDAGPAALPTSTPTDLATVINRLLHPKAHRRGRAERALDDLN